MAEPSTDRPLPVAPAAPQENTDAAAALKKAQEAAVALAAKVAAEPAEEEVDPLDAFMAAEVLPEVKAKEEEERKHAEEERKKLKELLQVRKVYKANTIKSN